VTIEIVRAIGLCTVQDLGRRGHMHDAVPPGGALVPELLVAANRRVGNPDGAAAIEVLGQLVVKHEGREVIVESAPRRAAYFAVRGGIEAPRVLDGRGTLLCAGLGKPLSRGDVLRVGNERPRSGTKTDRAEPVDLEPSDLITIVPGPDDDAFVPDALDDLERSTYRVSASSDRVGTRLEGPSLHRVAGYRERSRPMVIGALEVPRDGLPIVLGPEHPTTGGYPVIGVIASAELGRFFAIRLGGTVRFRVAR
jgi:allophanate hydrolase subunit 2